jgi:glutamyl-tRNA reductase
MSHLIVCGLNYNSAPIEIREQFTIPQSCLKHALSALSSMPHIEEVALLSTCNRTEVYAVVSDIQAGFREIDAFYGSVRSVDDHEVLRPNFKLLCEDVALHLFRVASGLDSIVLGEGQIMAQIKAAHQAAVEAKTVGPILNHLFNLALNCGKRVRTETNIGRRAVSVSSAAVELGRHALGTLEGKNVVVIGAGKMAQICLKLLMAECQGGKISVVNRSQTRISKFLQNNLPNRDLLHLDASFDDRHTLAADSDLVIVAASSPEYLLVKEQFAKCLRKTKKQVCIIDISVPRNVDPSLSTLKGVRLFHADHLANIVTCNLAERQALLPAAEKIIFECLNEHETWQRSLLAVPTITGLRQKIESIRQEQISKIRIACSTSSSMSVHAEIEQLSHAIVNQILHQPTVELKTNRNNESLHQHVEALKSLFRLDIA